MNFVESRKFPLIFERVISRVISAVAISLVGNEQLGFVLFEQKARRNRGHDERGIELERRNARDSRRKVVAGIRWVSVRNGCSTRPTVGSFRCYNSNFSQNIHASPSRVSARSLVPASGNDCVSANGSCAVRVRVVGSLEGGRRLESRGDEGGSGNTWNVRKVNGIRAMPSHVNNQKSQT